MNRLISFIFIFIIYSCKCDPSVVIHDSLKTDYKAFISDKSAPVTFVDKSGNEILFKNVSTEIKNDTGNNCGPECCPDSTFVTESKNLTMSTTHSEYNIFFWVTAGKASFLNMDCQTNVGADYRTSSFSNIPFDSLHNTKSQLFTHYNTLSINNKNFEDVYFFKATYIDSAWISIDRLYYTAEDGIIAFGLTDSTRYYLK